MKHQIRRRILLLALALLLAACGSDKDSGSDGGDVIDLTQSLAVEVEGGYGSFTVYYPEDWVAEATEFGEITVANSQAVLDKSADPNAVPEPGEVGASSFVIPAAMYLNFGMAEDVPPADAIDGYLAVALAETDSEGGSDSGSMGDPEKFDANGHPAAIISGTIREGDMVAGAIMMVVAFEGGMGFTYFFTHPDETGDYTALARAMAGQFEFTPATPE